MTEEQTRGLIFVIGFFTSPIWLPFVFDVLNEGGW